ncbi:hypothetical protein VPFG_00071 [Vibrio phage nt-1]|uniref:Uncharacterized protein n=1 Tax=Vibrio phage nt-1 TaxID=115992 RepID=R9TG53_9CAUD|nr:hypothetical protein VPFG_00071 [Vibrio phage nt-1]AGN30073.1 hypothetical protein VPFG_00071 [Vibrio phage nt-1]
MLDVQDILGEYHTILFDERVEAALRMDIARDQEQKDKMIGSLRYTLGQIQQQQRMIDSKLALLHSLLDLKQKVTA